MLGNAPFAIKTSQHITRKLAEQKQRGTEHTPPPTVSLLEGCAAESVCVLT